MYNSRGMSVVLVVSFEIAGNALHRQVGVGRVVTPGSLGGVMISTQAQNARDVGSIPTIFPIVII